MKKMSILLPLLFWCQSSFSCTCIDTETVKSAIKKSDVVFVGKLIAKSEFYITVDTIPGFDKIYFVKNKFLVETLYKGKLKSDTIEITTGRGNGDCGFPFVLGEEYVIYSTYKNKLYQKGSRIPCFLYTDNCTRTKTNNINETNEIQKYKKPRKIG